MRRGLSHCLETNRAVYDISDVVQQIVYARMLSPGYNSPATFVDYPCEPTLLVGYKLFTVLSFPKKFCKR